MSSTEPNSFLLSDDSINIPNQQERKTEKFLFFLLGNAALLIYNIVINAVDIFNDITNRTDMGTILNRAYNFPCSFIALILCFIKPKNLKISLIIGLIILGLLMCILPIFILCNVSSKLMYWAAVLITGISAVLSSLVSSSAFSLAAQTDSECTTAVSSGNGCCGVIAAGLRIITKAAFSSKKQLIISSAAYFYLTALILFFTLVYFIRASRIPSLENKMISKEDETFSCNTSIIQTIKVIWVEWLSVFFCFLVTLSIFPGYILTNVKEAKKIGDWTSVIITAIFCIFDWVGRYLPAKIQYPSIRYAWIPNVLRVLFILIFILSIQQIVDLGDPYWTFLWDIPFALTNGYFGTLSLLYGSNNEQLLESERGLAGFLMSFSINAGIIVAMFLTFAFDKLPQKKFT